MNAPGRRRLEAAGTVPRLRAPGTALHDRGEGGAAGSAAAVSAWMLPEPDIASGTLAGCCRVKWPWPSLIQMTTASSTVDPTTSRSPSRSISQATGLITRPTGSATPARVVAASACSTLASGEDPALRGTVRQCASGKTAARRAVSRPTRQVRCLRIVSILPRGEIDGGLRTTQLQTSRPLTSLNRRLWYLNLRSKEPVDRRAHVRW
jgi:hypothetical protein